MSKIIPDQTGYTSVVDVIDGAFRLVRGVSNTDPITALDRENAFFILSMMVDEWSAESLMVPAVAREEFETCCAQTTYLMGPHGDWNTSRPTLIRDMRILFGGVDVPVRVVGYDDYAAVRLKTLQVDPATIAWPDYAHPLCAVHLYPVPASTLTVTVISEKPLADFRGMFDAVRFPPGYESALVYGLSLRLGNQNPVDAQIAANAKRQVKARNARTTTLAMPAPLAGRGRRYNILSDGY